MAQEFRFGGCGGAICFNSSHSPPPELSTEVKIQTTPDQPEPIPNESEPAYPKPIWEEIDEIVQQASSDDGVGAIAC